MTADLAWIDAALTGARPQAIGALLRYFRDLDTAEEAFQEACLRALQKWPVNGPPRDPAALAGAINQLLGDVKLRQRLAAGGQTTAARFSITAVAAQYAALYQQLLG